MRALEFRLEVVETEEMEEIGIVMSLFCGAAVEGVWFVSHWSDLLVTMQVISTI